MNSEDGGVVPHGGDGGGPAVGAPRQGAIIHPQIRLGRSGTLTFSAVIPLPGLLPEFCDPRDYRGDGRDAVTVSFDVRAASSKKKKKKGSLTALRVTVLVDSAPASRVVFIPDIDGKWHPGDNFLALHAYKGFLPGIFTCSVGRAGGAGQAGERLLWLHRCLMSFLKVEAS